MVAAAPPHPHPLPRRRNPAVGRVLAVAVSVPLEPPTPPEPPGPVCGSACPLPRRVGAGRTGLSESSPRGLERLCTSPAVAATAAALPAPFAPRVPIGRARVLTMCVFPRRCVGFEGVGCVCVWGGTPALGTIPFGVFPVRCRCGIRILHVLGVGKTLWPATRCRRVTCGQILIPAYPVRFPVQWEESSGVVPMLTPGLQAVSPLLGCGKPHWSEAPAWAERCAG